MQPGAKRAHKLQLGTEMHWQQSSTCCAWGRANSHLRVVKVAYLGVVKVACHPLQDDRPIPQGDPHTVKADI